VRRLCALILILLSLFGSTGAQASVFSECGYYRIFGTVESEGARPVLVVFQGSMSETRLRIEPDSSSPDALDAFRNLSGHLGRRVSLRGRIHSPVSGRKGAVELQSIIPTLPIGLFQGSPSDEYQLNEKVRCQTSERGIASGTP